MSDEVHETQLHNSGTYYSWTCTCGKGSRHMALLHRAIRNAKAHVSKAKREAAASQQGGSR